MNKLVRFVIVLLIPVIAIAQQYNYFPPPGVTYTQAGGMALGSATGGAQGAGTLNAQGLYVNGTSVLTSGVTSFSGDGVLLSNSSSTGAVTATLGNTGTGYGVWGNTGASSGSPGYHALSSYPTAAFPTLNQSTTGNAATATALASTPGLCSTGQAPTGILASGNATGCASITGATGANPSASVTLSAQNGSASTFMRSDAAPPLSQSISPTWTGNHVFTPGSGVGVVINGAASSDSLDVNNAASQYAKIIGSSTTGSSNGLDVVAGTNSSDAAVFVTNRSGSTSLFEIFGDGGTTVGNPTGGDEGAGTLNAQNLYVNGTPVATAATGCTTGTFTGTATGLTATVTGTFFYSICGYQVTLFNINNVTGTSNTNSLTLTGLPAGTYPSGTHSGENGTCTQVEDSGTVLFAVVQVSNVGVLTAERGSVSGSNLTYSTTGFTSSGTKGFPPYNTCIYSIL